ncbi:MAG: response regulator, partial [Spirochaetaceae bacterium]
LNRTVEDVVAIIAHQFRRQQVEIHLELAPDIPLMNLDVDKFKQVCMNLLINARQAMSKGGVVTLAVRNRTIGEGFGFQIVPGIYVEIGIIDTGPGIPQENLSRIFDPFFTTKKEGSGLGLAICYSIIKRHGGHISVSSKPGEGTLFEILLPATEEKESVEMEKLAVSVRGSGRILILDDEDVILEVTADMMKNLGYEVTTSVEGKAAVEVFKNAFDEKRKFDLVILDLTIPGGLGGKDIIDSLRGIDPGIKALVSSGYSDDPVLAKPEIYGFTGAIAKPYRLKELALILQKHLSEDDKQ